MYHYRQTKNYIVWFAGSTNFYRHFQATGIEFSDGQPDLIKSVSFKVPWNKTKARQTIVISGNKGPSFLPSKDTSSHRLLLPHPTPFPHRDGTHKIAAGKKELGGTIWNLSMTEWTISVAGRKVKANWIFWC